jgi:hypothetical protein
MSGCSQTNAPTITITPDPCNGNHFASSCIFHEPSILFLGVAEDTNLQDILTAISVKMQQQANSITLLSQMVEDLQQQINNCCN